MPTRTKITGVCQAARGLWLAEWLATATATCRVIVCEESETALKLTEDTGIFLKALGDKLPPFERLIFPEAMQGRSMREDFAASADRTTALAKLRQAAAGKQPPLLIFTTPAALLQPVPAIEELTSRSLTLKRGQQQPFSELVARLNEFDYDHEVVCEEPGQYAVRGGIIDVYPVTADAPVRLDFFGDEIEAIRTFDPTTQRSGQAAAEVTITTSPRVKLTESKTGICAYLPQETELIFIEPATVEESFSLLRQTAAAETEPLLNKLLRQAAAVIGVGDLDEESGILAGAKTEEWKSEPLKLHRNFVGESLLGHERVDLEEAGRREFFKKLKTWQNEGRQVAVVSPKEADEKRIREILKSDTFGKKLKPLYLRGTLNEGFLAGGTVEKCHLIGDTSAGRRSIGTGAAGNVGASLDDARRLRDKVPSSELSAKEVGDSVKNCHLIGDTSERRKSVGAQAFRDGSLSDRGVVVVTETEIFGRMRARRIAEERRVSAQRAQVDQLLDFSELVERDYVVHLQHGIAHFRGLGKIEVHDGEREMISLEFADGVMLHVPLQESHLISRYVGLAKVRPQLGKIGSARWEKTRRAAERATVDLAADLLRLQAVREAQPGFAFSKDNDWQREFEAAFPFTETRDQLRAIRETKLDMERARPMDRLICGDVGFGKTEVAIRAAFKAVQDGRQVVVLVPTTVLAQQHLNTFRERMAGYPVVVEMLSRFRTRSEQQRISAAVAAGQVDILIGTHRLLQGDVVYKNLGLVVIDEEQRFGVRHKEKLKNLRASVDVLSMSATPIPRTLYMAMTGAREMSVIETPPVNRHPIQTIVKTYDEALIVDAVRHEVRRGGQVFYLHNRVQTIDGVASRLRVLLPDLKIGVGHGQMKEGELERVMTDFVAGKFQVLVCTTIIESGLDIPNCNTLIIEGADRFGLSQLYQLRGRVGRFRHQAYAYLLLRRHSHLMAVARERLNALRTHNQLGAGFRIAMRDLELRGAGNLLGSQQSGHIVGVGFELYCQLLKQSVARLKGEKQAAALRASVSLDFVFVGDGSLSEAKRAREKNAFQILRDAEEAGGSLSPMIQARIPSEYVSETRLRIDAYRRLAMAENLEQVREIGKELTDRFGKFGDAVRALLLVTEVRVLAERKGLVSVVSEKTRLKCLRASGRRDDFVMHGNRFPRLTAPKPLLRLREIISFLNNLSDP